MTGELCCVYSYFICGCWIMPLLYNIILSDWWDVQCYLCVGMFVVAVSQHCQKEYFLFDKQINHIMKKDMHCNLFSLGFSSILKSFPFFKLFKKANTNLTDLSYTMYYTKLY